MSDTLRAVDKRTHNVLCVTDLGHFACLSADLISKYKRIRRHSLKHWCIIYCFPVVFKSSSAKAAWSHGLERGEKSAPYLIVAKNKTKKKRWNVAGIWLQWWSVALVTGRGFRWRLMRSWWQKAKGSQCMKSTEAISLVCECVWVVAERGGMGSVGKKSVWPLWLWSYIMKLSVCVLSAYYLTICWRDLESGSQDDAGSHIAGKSTITTMMKWTNKQRNCKTKHVADKTCWETQPSLVLFADCIYPLRAFCMPVTSPLDHVPFLI